MSIEISNIEEALKSIESQVLDIKNEVIDLEREIDKKDELIENLRSDAFEGVNTVNIPYLLVDDQLKADQLIEHWEKIPLSAIDKMIASL